MADKFHSDTEAKIELIAYSPGKQDTGDLESGTNTITATSEASGLGNADYNAALTLASPDDARMVVDRICAKLDVVIDSFNAGCSQMTCRVYVDAQDADHRIFDAVWNSTGTKLQAVDIYSGFKPVVLALLKDGAAHTFYFYFFVDTGNGVLSQVQLWEGVGTCAQNGQDVITLSHTGWLCIAGSVNKQGTGSAYLLGGLVSGDQNKARLFTSQGLLGNAAYPNPQFLIAGTCYFLMLGTVASDLNYLDHLYLTLKREQ